ncbi:chemotaxis protein, partial [Clostridium perfringens]|nr:chemotaxis protein [Clostridium perfringens]
MGLFSKSKKNSEVTKNNVEEISNEFVTTNISKKENANENLKNEMVMLSESSSSISSAIHDVNSSLSNLTTATLTQAEEINNVNNIMANFNSRMEQLAYNV